MILNWLNQESIADVASVFAEFYSDLNVPSSDIAAGFVLLSKYQAAQRDWILKHDKERLGIEQYLSNIPIREDTKFLDISTADDSHLVNDLIYYMNYSLAIFGWPLQMVDDPCMLCCIYPYLRISPCSSGRNRTKTTKKKRKKKKKDEEEESGSLSEAETEAAEKKDVTDPTNQDRCDTKSCSNDTDALGNARKQSIAGRLNDDCNVPIILEDNCCSCNAASAERRLARHNYEIIYISYKSTISVVPFLVAADHSKQTIVVAIRGSMSLSDMVTDMNGTVDKLPIEDCPDDWLCHRGITRAASYVKTTLIEEHILDRAFSCRPDLGSRNYQLILCGHSLGAGAAAILGILMRKQYPSLRAYLYSPPGGILSMPAVEYTKQFAYGIILGNDTVARLGIAQLERLRYHILLSLDSTQRSSSRILARALCPSMCFGHNNVDYDPEHSLDLLHGSGGRSFDHNGTKIPFQSQPQVLYVPGRLIHVVKNYSFKTKTRRLWNGPIYQAIWTENANYDRILISEGMFFDHLPHNLMHSMKMLFSNTLPGRRESAKGLDSASIPVENDVSFAKMPGSQELDLVPSIGFMVKGSKESDGNEFSDDEKMSNVIVDKNNNSNGNDDDDDDDDENNNYKLDTSLYPTISRDMIKTQERNSQTSISNNIGTDKKAEHRLDENGNEQTSSLSLTEAGR